MQLVVVVASIYATIGLLRFMGVHPERGWWL
jgi:hypothetical protein